MGHGDREDEAHIGEGCVMEVMERPSVDKSAQLTREWGYYQ